MSRREPEPPPSITVLDLKAHATFTGVAAEVLSALVAAGTTHLFEPEALILKEHEEAEHFFVLVRGSAKVFYTAPGGFEVVVKIFGAPAAFGEMEILADIPYVEHVEAVERALVLAVPRVAFLAALRASHVLTTNLLKDVSARLCIAAQNERSLAFDPLEIRLANLLTTYLEFYGLPVPDGIKIRIPLNQDELAAALGVSRRSITRALRMLLDDGILKKSGKHFIVRDTERLSHMSDPSVLRIGYKVGEPIRAKAPRRA